MMNNESMSPALARKVRYIKERCNNAVWMLRNGKFKLILKSIALEIQHRIRDIREWRKQAKRLDDSQVPGSAYVDNCKIVPPSPRPTGSRILPRVPLQCDAQVVSTELKGILATLAIQDVASS